MEMCRFTGLDDIEYKKVAAVLLRMTSSKQPRAAHFLSEEQRLRLLETLRFDQIQVRQMTIKRAHTKTCQWLLKKSEYLDWLDTSKIPDHYGFLWIKGKPGAGKSTMMKFAFGSCQKRMKDRIVISYFFNARGTELEKSTIGMYRSLLVQLLEQLPELQCVFDNRRFTDWDSKFKHQYTELLETIFEDAIQRLGQSSLICYIDALDECEERQIRDMVKFFQRLGELALSAGIQFQVCFSSRHYPHITITKGLTLVLEGQEGHSQDITTYIDSELKIGHSKLAEQIRLELQEKAMGVFMWVVLVVDILNKEHDGGRIHALRKRLRDIPSDLHELFRDILTRDCHNKNELILCIQWLLFARHPLSPEELYFAILSVISPQQISKWDQEEVTVGTIQRFILNSSKGLAEITKSKEPTIQFIHESVKDFLLKENGLSALLSDLGMNFEGQSHEQLKLGCLHHLSVDLTAHFSLAATAHKASSKEAGTLRQSATKAFPFLQYAVQNVLYHADSAQRSGIDQKNFLSSFELAKWVTLDNVFEKHEVRRHTSKASLSYILAEHNMPNLVRILPSDPSCFKVEDERYGLPIFAAWAHDNDEVIQVFLSKQVEKFPPTSPLHEIYNQYLHDSRRGGGFGRDFTYNKRRGVVSYLAQYGDERLLRFLLETKDYDLDGVDNYHRSPLWWAATHGHEAMVQLLLEKDVDTDAKDKDDRTPLIQASMKGHEAVVELLLQKSHKIDMQDNEGLTALSWAVVDDHPDIIKLLLQNGADADIRERSLDQTALSVAASNGNGAVIQLLLDTGKIDVEARDNLNRTPLMIAAINGHEAMVRLLLDTGKTDPSVMDYDGRTALCWASREGHRGVVQVLLDDGRVDSDSRDAGGRTPLGWASINGHKAVVQLLLDTGNVNVDSKDNSGSTALFWATMSGNEAIVRLLIEKGKANVSLEDNFSNSPLLIAAERGHETVFKLILNTGMINVDGCDGDGQTPLSKAAENGHGGIVKMLLNTNLVDADKKVNNGRTPLWYAATKGHKAIAEQLLATNKVDINVKDQGGRSPLSVASTRGFKDIVMMLLEKQANFEAQDKCGLTPLSCAVKHGHKAIVQLLLDVGVANVNHKDKYDRTGLWWAVATGNKAITKLILDTERANVNIKDHHGLTPLLMATKHGNGAVALLLLDSGKVDIDTTDEDGHTALWWARRYMLEDVIAVLEAQS